MKETTVYGRVMKIVKSMMLVMVISIIVFSWNPANASTSVQYNINGWSQYSGNLAASYVDGSNLLVSASSLSPTNGLYIPGNSNMGGNGKFWFAGWHSGGDPISNPSIQFSITASQPVSLGTMSYSWFSGNWSDIWFGPNYLDVCASTDNWATYQLIDEFRIYNSHPDSDGSNYCIDDLSSLGVLSAGETVSIRFVGCGAGGDAAGFVHEFPDQQNLMINVTPTPEPATIFLLTLGGLVLRKRKA